MNFPFFIAKRYLFSKKSHNVINVISIISVIGVMFGTAALIIVLSVFNGFEGLVMSLFNSFDADLKVTAREGKTFNINEIPLDEIKNIPGLIHYSEVIEENALLKYDDNQFIATIKGVDSDYMKMTGVDTMIIDGEFLLKYEERDYAVFGSGVAYYLDINLNDFIKPISVYVPKRKESFSWNIADAFKSSMIFPSGVFSIQQEYDVKYVLVPIEFARELLDYSSEVSAIEIGVGKNAEIDKIQYRLKNLLGEKFEVKNRYQQQEFVYKVMRSEKWAIFFILAFILIIAIFNVIGSLTMLILEKKRDIGILWGMGANQQKIRRIFRLEGILITMFGAVLGLFIGFIICWIQQTFGVIQLNGGNTFIVDAYPVQMQYKDFLLVFGTVLTIGLITSWFPVRQISKRYIKVSPRF